MLDFLVLICLYINHYCVSFKSVVNFLLKNKHKVSVKLLSISFKGVKENLTHLQMSPLICKVVFNFHSTLFIQLLDKHKTQKEFQFISIEAEILYKSAFP